MKHRLELFSDAVFAIIITVMLLEMRTPTETGWRGWVPLLPTLAAYSVTFVIVLVGWWNHHQVFSRIGEISFPMYWANGAALFFASFIPLALHNFTEHQQDPTALALYLIIVFLAPFCMTLLRWAAAKEHGNDPGWREWSRQRNRVLVINIVLQATAIGLAYVSMAASITLYLLALAFFIFGTPRKKQV